jgi:hypothetical protein
MNAESEEDRAKVESLFEKCVQDYMCKWHMQIFFKGRASNHAKYPWVGN